MRLIDNIAYLHMLKKKIPKLYYTGEIEDE